jgi:thiol:disulfide interchange protein
MRYLHFILFTFISTFVFAQGPTPVKWTYETKCLAAPGEYELIFKAAIPDHQTLYSQNIEGDGPIPTTFEFAKAANYTLIGKVQEIGNAITINDPLFDNAKVTKYKHDVIFKQKVKVSDISKPISGYLNYMTCNDNACMPPKDVDFSFKLPVCAGANITPVPNTTIASTPNTTVNVTPNTTVNITSEGKKDTTKTVVVVPTDDANFKGTFDSKRAIDVLNPSNGSCGSAQVANDDDLLKLFFLAFLGGLLALLTPCVFPMIPLTVSFFTKGSGSRAKGIRNAIIYGLSIIVIYVTIGIAITAAFGPNTLNAMATNPWVNTIFFILFVVFAFSFFGFYEITLPSSWSNSSDKAADKGGLIGIFFMAFTLALVSFSCTGPIIGSLLVQTVSNAQNALFGFIPVKPLVGMFGFSLALALPFALFAMFPSWLNSLPKSGGWMVAVKVTLGFLELAFALKFLSTADLVAHWGFLRWELFIGLWMVIFAALGLYHFSKLHFPHDNPNRKIGTGNWIVGLASLALVIYLAFGFQYKPLSLLSGLAPSYTYNFFGPKGCVHGIDCFHDFDEAVAYAKKVNKPVFVDFTGYGCVNCRKMEENVWVKPEILKYLKEDYVVVSLYVDDEARLFPDNKQQYLTDKNDGEKIRTVGAKWSSFQRNNFHEASQPQYILMDNDGQKVLTHPKTYTPNIEEYKAFLECGVNTFKSLKK